MAQTGYTPLLIYSSSTAAAAPAAGNLTNSTLGSELAINITDGKLFYKDNGGSVQVIAWKTTPTTAGGTGLTSYTAGDLLYYASGTTLTKLEIGSAYQALQVNAGGTAPSWQPSATSVLTAQGDLLYASGANTLARLAKNTTATRYLSNTGASNNPAWAQVDLTNGVTGVLPNANTTGATAATANTLLLRDGSGNGTVATLNCSFISNSGNYQQAYGQALNSTTSGGSTSHMMSYQTWSGNANTLVVGNTFGPVVFATGGGVMTGKALLHTSGGFSIGNTTDPGAGALSVSGAAFLNTNATGLQTSRSMSFVTTGASVQYISHSTSDGNGDPYMEFGYNGTKIGSITQSGTTGVNFNTTSDYRLKDVSGPLTGSGEYIDSLEVVQGTWKSDGSVFIGLIAHQAQEVSKTNVATGEKDGQEMQSLAYANPEFIANMIAELQSLRRRVAQLEAKG